MFCNGVRQTGPRDVIRKKLNASTGESTLDQGFFLNICILTVRKLSDMKTVIPYSSLVMKVLRALISFGGKPK